MKYNHKKAEAKVQEFWKENRVFESNLDTNKAKYYILDMFPYPSGDGLHVGHVKGYSASDLIAHYKRLNGFNVLHPMGWDAFGLPAENYAIKIKKNPKEVVSANIEKFKSQMEAMGFSYDWSREINTTDPKYYKWTQWIFLKMFEKGLAYQDEVPINFCPSCKTGLANEEVISGECERCHSKVTKKRLKQWILRITDYADRLLEDLDNLDWPEPIKEMQKNWIGRSEGSKIVFEIDDSDEKIEVFTTRVDTLFGCTWVVLAPEHELVEKITSDNQKQEVNKYLVEAQNKSDLERAELQKTKTGVFTGAYATNPINGEKVPVWVADYVLATYGSGAVMAVPAHDERDFEFAKKYNLEIRQVVSIDGKKTDLEEAFVDDGTLLNSGDFSGLRVIEAKQKITDDLKSKNAGDFTINYKLRDWIFSRQRYWGEPIPIVHCEKCGAVAVPESELPVKLPDLENYEPTGTGESPLKKVESWVNTTCPKCSGPARRETNTMPQWAGSCWYYIAFALSKKLKVKSEKFENIFSKYTKELDYLPVDFYIGGAEHAVLHLLYARFWHKFLYDIKKVKDSEPFKKLKNVGMIMGPDNQKMSKSRGNVINPDELIEKYGVDALRMYELFIGPFDQSAAWNINGITGTKKFLDKVAASYPGENIGHSNANIQQLINSITEKIEKNLFNTAVSDFMKFANENDLSKLSQDDWEKFLIILSPFAPHLAEHINLEISKDSIFKKQWPQRQETDKICRYVIQLNGKRKAVIDCESKLSEKEITAKALADEKVKNALSGKEIRKTIFVKNKIINFVV